MGLRLSALVAVLVASVAVGGCGDAERVEPDLQTLDSLNVAVGLGVDPAGPALDLIRDATFAHSGEVLILTRSAPYIQWMSRDGEVLRVLGEPGDGPGEVRNPLGIGADSAGMVAVAGGSRVTLFDSTGVEQGRIEGLDPPPRGVWGGCADSWIVLSPPAEDSVAGLVGVQTDGLVGRAYARFGTRRRNMLDHPPFIAGTAGDAARAVVFSEELEGSRVMELDCESKDVRTLAQVPLGQAPDMVRTSEVRADGSYEARWDRGTEPFPSGVAILGERVIWADRLGELAEEWSDRRTRFFVLQDGEWREGFRLVGHYTLHAAHPTHGVLISAARPVPSVYVLDATGFVERLAVESRVEGTP